MIQLSGTRQRLATALGKNRSFVSQTSNAIYAVPIPASHIELIFGVARLRDACVAGAPGRGASFG